MKIFCDFDDTLFQSSKRVIDIINRKYGLNKTVNDLADWGYRSIHKQMTGDEVNDIYEMQELFDGLEPMDDALEVLRPHEVIVCTKGTPKNIEKKTRFVFKLIPGIREVCIANEGKEKYNMAGCVQIDDRYDNLEKTNAAVKILFKNFNDFTWQKCPPHSDVYVVNTWKEIEDILNFIEGDIGE